MISSDKKNQSSTAVISSEQNQTGKKIAFSSNWDPTTCSSSWEREIHTAWCKQKTRRKWTSWSQLAL